MRRADQLESVENRDGWGSLFCVPERNQEWPTPPNGQIVEFVYSANPALKTWSNGGAQVARSKMRIRVAAVPCVEETTLFV